MAKNNEFAITGTEGKEYDLDRLEKSGRSDSGEALAVHVHEYKDGESPNPENPKVGSIWVSKMVGASFATVKPLAFECVNPPVSFQANLGYSLLFRIKPGNYTSGGINMICDDPGLKFQDNTYLSYDGEIAGDSKEVVATFSLADPVESVRAANRQFTLSFRVEQPRNDIINMKSFSVTNQISSIEEGSTYRFFVRPIPMNVSYDCEVTITPQDSMLAQVGEDGDITFTNPYTEDRDVILDIRVVCGAVVATSSMTVTVIKKAVTPPPEPPVDPEPTPEPEPDPEPNPEPDTPIEPEPTPEPEPEPETPIDPPVDGGDTEPNPPDVNPDDTVYMNISCVIPEETPKSGIIVDFTIVPASYAGGIHMSCDDYDVVFDEATRKLYYTGSGSDPVPVVMKFGLDDESVFTFARTTFVDDATVPEPDPTPEPEQPVEPDPEQPVDPVPNPEPEPDPTPEPEPTPDPVVPEQEESSDSKDPYIESVTVESILNRSRTVTKPEQEPVVSDEPAVDDFIGDVAEEESVTQPETVQTSVKTDVNAASGIFDLSDEEDIIAPAVTEPAVPESEIDMSAPAPEVKAEPTPEPEPEPVAVKEEPKTEPVAKEPAAKPTKKIVDFFE